MSAISSIPAVNTLPLQVPASAPAEIENTDAISPQAPPPLEKPVIVTISAEGKEKLAGEQQKNADIDVSKLPDSIKKYLKSIREIQEKIDKKMEELQAAMSDHSLSDKERQGKISKIQLELSVLSGILTSITNDLRQKEVELKLQAPDLRLVNALMAPRGK